jgi:hypothetical protein
VSADENGLDQRLRDRYETIAGLMAWLAENIGQMSGEERALAEADLAWWREWRMRERLN